MHPNGRIEKSVNSGSQHCVRSQPGESSRPQFVKNGLFATVKSEGFFVVGNSTPFFVFPKHSLGVRQAEKSRTFET